MNWFERHLNDTVIFIAVVCWALSVFLTFVSGGRALFPFLWASSVALFLCYLLLATGHGWVLYKKNRNPAFLLIYLPAFLVITSSVILNENIPPDADPSPTFLFFGIFVNLIIHLIGLGTILFLSNNKDNPVSRRNVLYRIYQSKPTFLRFAFSVAGILLVVFISSFLFTHFVYSSYSHNESGKSSISGFMFTYPAKYKIEEDFYNGPFFIPSLNTTIDLGRTNFEKDTIGLTDSQLFGDSSWITIEVFSPNLFLVVPSDNSTAIRDFVISNKITFNGFYKDKYEIIDKLTMIDGTPAYQLGFSSNKLPSEFFYREYLSLWGTTVCVYFQHDGRLWIITWENRDTALTQPPPYFTRLLESFKFIVN